ncbi:hypothetical protein LSAT2_026993 [Lamellibrachia satsuma]|nr:hypothetical protein LSAT2_026993 [Lamellibrachia satsuma]
MDAVLTKKWFPTSQLVDATTTTNEVKDIRNALMHASNFTMTTADTKTHIQAMIRLLEQPALQRYQCASDAIDDLNKIDSIDLDVTDRSVLQTERDMWKDSLTELDSKQSRLTEECVQNCAARLMTRTHKSNTDSCVLSSSKN